MATDFPFVIKGETRDMEEEDIAKKVFQLLSATDTQTLLACREVSTSWRYGIDSFSGLWSRMSLFKAIRDNRTDICKLIIEHSDNKNSASEYGSTPLHLAARRGHTELCRLIIDSVKEKNPADGWGETPLHAAAEAGHTEICKLIIEKVDNKNPQTLQGGGLWSWSGPYHPLEPGDTPLHVASRNGHIDICRLILESVDEKDPAWFLDSSGTPFNVAKRNGHTDVCELMKNHY